MIPQTLKIVFLSLLISIIFTKFVSHFSQEWMSEWVSESGRNQPTQIWRSYENTFAIQLLPGTWLSVYNYEACMLHSLGSWAHTYIQSYTQHHQPASQPASARASQGDPYAFLQSPSNVRADGFSITLPLGYYKRSGICTPFNVSSQNLPIYFGHSQKFGGLYVFQRYLLDSPLGIIIILHKRSWGWMLSYVKKFIKTHT